MTEPFSLGGAHLLVADPLAFERILDHLCAIDEAQWQRELADTEFATLMVHDLGNTILTSLLDRELAAPQ